MNNISNASIISDCEICGTRMLPTLLNMGSHPLCDDLIPIGSNSSNDEYPIEVLWCNECGTAHQKYQVPKAHLFPRDYHYRARFTANVLNGMKELVDSCEHEIGALTGKVVLDVGCNDGSLLSIFRNKGAITIGVEPTDAYADASSAGHDVMNSFFSRETANQLVEKHGYPDIVTFTNVFAHIENLPELIEALKIILAENTILVIENHYLGSVLEKGQFDTFYHEHPRTYSLNSFVHIAKLLDRKIISYAFPARYGGNVRVFIASSVLSNNALIDNLIEQHIAKEEAFADQLKDLGNRIQNWRIQKRNEILTLVRMYGPLPAKSFPGRAAILIKLLGLTVNEISAVHEKPGSMKIGNYVPGTRIPIISDDLMSINSPVVINLAWHIRDEIKNYLRNRGFIGEILDIYTPEEL